MAAAKVASVVVDMQQMQEAVCDGRQEYGDGAEKSNAAEQGIKGCKQFGCPCLHLIHRAHAGEDHAGIVKRVGPAEVSKNLVAGCPNSGGYHNHHHGIKEITQHPFQEQRVWQQFVVFVFKFQHGKRLLVRYVGRLTVTKLKTIITMTTMTTMTTIPTSSPDPSKGEHAAQPEQTSNYMHTLIKKILHLNIVWISCPCTIYC